MADHYPYRIASGRADLILIWQPGKDDAPDALAVDDVGRLLAFPDLDRLQQHCEDNGWGLVSEGRAPSTWTMYADGSSTRTSTRPKVRSPPGCCWTRGTSSTTSPTL